MYRLQQIGLVNLGAHRNLLAWMVAMLLGLTGWSTYAGPANDNFASAIGISNNVRQVTGSNIGATKESGEPNHAGNPGGASVWWVWTAGFSGAVDFNTEGSSFDTLLAVYTGTNVGQLTPVSGNDDVNFPADLTSKTVFAVTQGTTYFIAVDGLGGASGNVVLNWSPAGSFAAGTIGFVAPALTADGVPYYTVSELESTYVGANNGFNSAEQVRLVVSRLGGSSGSMEATYTVKASTYTNLFLTNLWVTNIYITNFDYTTPTVTTTFTNSFVTNEVVVDWHGYFLNGNFRFIEITNGQNFIVGATNGPKVSVFTNTGSVLPVQPQPCTGYADNVAGTTNSYGTNAMGATTFSNFVRIETLCTNIFVQQIVPSASAADFAATSPGTLKFRDYSMSAEIGNAALSVFPNDLGFIDALGGLEVVTPRLVEVTLTNVALDPLETPNLAAPTINPIIAKAYLSILPLYGMPNTPLTINLPGTPGAAVVNFTEATTRYREGNQPNDQIQIGVIRTGTNIATTGSSVDWRLDYGPGVEQNDGFTLNPGSEYATPTNPNPPPSSQPPDFVTATGTLTWVANDPFPVKFITISVTNDLIAEFNEDFQISLFNYSGCVGGFLTAATATIIDNETPAGTGDISYNRDNNAFTDPPYNALPGADAPVKAIVVQPDGKSIIAGDFLAFDTKARNHIARALLNGENDNNFLAYPNSGANGSINALALQPDGKIVAAGNFSSFNGSNRFSIVRLNSDGSVDSNFKPGLGIQTVGGVPGLVLNVALQPDGKILVAGDFNLVGGTNRFYVARLNSNGSVDTSFDPGASVNGVINAMALQADGKILIGGEFTTFAGLDRKYVARLNSDGSLDNSFDTGTGADNTVYAIAVQQDGRVVIGGSFKQFNLGNHSRLVRLNTDGSLDTSFDVGSGLDEAVYTILMQNDGRILIGGIFEQYNQTRRMGLARILPSGVLDTSWMDSTFNQFAGLYRDFSSEELEPRAGVFTMALQPFDQNLVIGGNFQKLGGAPGLYDGTFTAARNQVVFRQNVARMIGGSTPGPGNVGLLYPSYSSDKNGKKAYISMVRENGFLGEATVNLTTTAGASGNGNAVEGLDYSFDSTKYGTLTWSTTYGNTWMISDSLSGTNSVGYDDINSGIQYTGFADAFVTLLNPRGGTNVGNRSLGLQVSLPPDGVITMNMGGEPIALGVGLGLTHGDLAIIDNAVPNGIIGFTSPNFVADQNSTNAVITLTRTNGSSGLVTVQYATANGTNNLPFTVGAISGSTNDYLATSGTLTFGNGVTNQSFRIPLINNGQVKADATVQLFLTHETGGALPGLTNATLTIINDNLTYGRINLSATNYSVHENDGFVTVTATREGGSAGTVKVSYFTLDGSATSGNDYAGVANTLTWNNGDVSPKTFTIPIFPDHVVRTNNKTLSIRLANATVNTIGQSAVLRNSFTNATVSILNDDQFGKPSFSIANFHANANSGFATITVVRQGGSSQTITVDYKTADFTATIANGDYQAVSGTLTFSPGVFSQSFNVPILEHLQSSAPGVNNQFLVILTNALPSSGPGGAVQLGQYARSFVTIIDNWTYNQPPGGVDPTFFPGAYFNDTVYSLVQQPDGKIVAGGDFTVANAFVRNRIARLNQDGTLDIKFSSSSGGTDGTVRSIAVQTDSGILIAGGFSQVNSVNRGGIARLNVDGSLDTAFNPGSGLDNTAYALAETFSANGTNNFRKVLVGGNFTLVNGFPLHGIAQLNNDGSVDQNFQASGVNGAVYGIAVYSTNDINSRKIIIVGDFTSVNGVGRNGIARLNADGSLDTNFDPGVGADQPLRAVAVQVDGKILIGGLFSSVDGTPASRLARLNPDGSLDSSFNAQPGMNDAVLTLAIQQDLKIMVGGSFTIAKGVNRGRITRLNSDGTVDPTINFGTGADSFISTILIQPDEKMVVAGGFQKFEGQSHPYIARIFGLSEQDAGAVSFSTGNFTAVESGTNALITVERTGGTVGAIKIDVVTSDGTAIEGQDYQGVSTTLIFPEGETFQSFLIPIYNNLTVGPDLTVNLTLQNPQGGVSLGNQPTAQLTIQNDNSLVSFTSPNYRIVKNSPTGVGIVYLQRLGSTLKTSSIDLTTTTNGTAIPGIDFTMVTNTFLFNPGVTQVVARIPIINNGLVEGDTTVEMVLSNPTNTVPTVPSTALLTIVDNNLAPGNIRFYQPFYSVLEPTGSASATTNAYIIVQRTNGLVGQVSVQLSVSGGTAIPGIDYTPTNQTLVFADGETTKILLIPILHNTQVTGNRTLNLTLSNPTGGSSIQGATTEVLTILDQDAGFAFSQPGYFVQETAGSVILSVQRIGRTNGAISVQYATADGIAHAGVNYSTTAGSLNFASGELEKSVVVPVLHDPRVTGNLNFLVNLSAPSIGTQLGTPSSAVVTVIDSDSALSFTTNSYTVSKAGTNILIPVVRSGSVTGTNAVNFTTFDGSAQAGVAYVGTNGVLTFVDGQTSNYFIVPIINDNLVDGNQTVNLSLFNSTNATVGMYSNAIITIVDNNTGFSFSSPTYSVSEGGVAATINVIRSGVLTNLSTINYATSDGTATNGINYHGVNGTLVFLPGVTNKTFTVPIIDLGVPGGNQTVVLTLSAGITNSGVLISPSAAVLTILNNHGGLVVPAGASLVSESFAPANGVIEPGERVTVLFGLRNSAGQSTSNLVVSLLATNGVTPIAPSSTTGYGALIAGGPTAFQPFTFTASGTNGGKLNAVLLVQDGTNVGTAIFSFILGATTNGFTNSTPIVINDNSAASPYPASLNVSGVNGVVGRVTVTVTNLSHAFFRDVNMLLVGPNGQKSLLLAEAPWTAAINGVTLTFDDASATVASRLGNFLPTNGVYRSSVYAPVPFLSPAPAAPYGSSLTNFYGINPNGIWSLYVYDNSAQDAGLINNGWSISFDTVNPVAASADISVGVTSTPAQVVITSKLLYTVSITNFGPSAASGLVISNTLPLGSTFVSSTPAPSSFVTNTGVLTLIYNLSLLGTSSVSTISINASAPANAGNATNVVSVLGTQNDPNLGNNLTTIITPITGALADVAIGLSGDVNPVLTGSQLTYSILVTNYGPASATNVVVTDTLPPGVQFVSASIGGVFANGSVIFTLGTLGSGLVVNSTVLVKAVTPGTVTNSVTVTSGVPDPLKGNNRASVKSIIQGLQLGISTSGGTVTLSWPASATGFVPQYSPSLVPSNWTNITNQAPVVINGFNVFTANQPGYYRLQGPGQ